MLEINVAEEQLEDLLDDALSSSMRDILMEYHKYF